MLGSGFESHKVSDPDPYLRVGSATFTTYPAAEHVVGVMKENKVLFHLHHHHIDHHIIGGCSPEGPKSNAGAAQTGLFSVKEKVKQNA